MQMVFLSILANSVKISPRKVSIFSVYIDKFQKGMLKAVLYKDEEGNLVREAGVMGIVLAGGEIRPGDAIMIDLPPKFHKPLVYTGELPYWHLENFILKTGR